MGCNSLTNVTIPNSFHNFGWQAFNNCTNLTNIYYDGTIEQWNAILKGIDWDANTGNYTIQCTDGDIAKA